MGTLGFEDYIEPLNLYLHKYREVWPAKLLYDTARRKAGWTSAKH